MGAKLGLFLKATSIYCYHHIGKISFWKISTSYFDIQRFVRTYFLTLGLFEKLETFTGKW